MLNPYHLAVDVDRCLKLNLSNGQFEKLVDVHENLSTVDPALAKELLAQPNLELWLYLDQILLDLAGNAMTWSEIVDHYKKNYPGIAQNVLSKT